MDKSANHPSLQLQVQCIFLLLSILSCNCMSKIIGVFFIGDATCTFYTVYNVQNVYDLCNFLQVLDISFANMIDVRKTSNWKYGLKN